jgi:hypothetical protein
VFVEADTDIGSLDGHTFDMRSAESGYKGEKCKVQVMLERHDL